MNKRFRSLLLLLVLIQAVSLISFNTASATSVFEYYAKANFDGCTLDTRGNTEAKATIATYTDEVGTFSMTYLKGREVSAVIAPSGKMDGTSLTTSGADKALQMNFVNGNTGNPSFYFTFDETKNLYEKDKIILSMNLLIDGLSGGAYLGSVMRYNTQCSNSIFKLTSKNISIYPGGAETPVVENYTGGKWYNIRYEFNPKARTYDFFIDNVKMAADSLHNQDLLFPGDPLLLEAGTTCQPIKDIRFTMASTTGTTVGAIYFDDIYFCSADNLKEDVEVKDTYFTNGTTKLEYIPYDVNTVYAKADVTYSKDTADKSFTLVAALYDDNDILKDIFYDDITLPETELSENVNYTASMSMSLSDYSLEDGSYFKLFAFENLGKIKPLFKSAKIETLRSEEIPSENPIIHLISDSIGAAYPEASFPQQGFGYYLSNYFNDKVTVTNWAQGGRSTRSFINSGRWDGRVINDDDSDGVTTTGVLNVIKPGDYVFVSLGHNDESTSPSRGTTIDEYKDNLRKFADETRFAGGNIIFITSITQASGENWSSRSFKTNTLLNRANAMKEVAAERKAVLLDVNAVTWNHFTYLGYQVAIDKYFMSNSAVREAFKNALTEIEIEGKSETEIEKLIDDKVNILKGTSVENPTYSDLVHLTFNGADYVACTIADLLKASGSPLKALLENQK